MTPANVYRRRGHDERRACNRSQQAALRSERRAKEPGHPCACGCGTLVSVDSNGRAVKLKRDVIECEWAHSGHCKGPLQVAHVNGDELENDPGNLLKLCTSHHRLLDNGRIDPTASVTPAFYTGRPGKRRYARAA